MRNIFSARYWALAILLCSTFLFSACKKDKGSPEDPTPVEDEITRLLRGIAFQRTLVTQVQDIKLAPVQVTSGDYVYTDGTGKKVTITGKGSLTLEKARGLAALVPKLVSKNEATVPVTIKWYYPYETFNGLYQIGISLKCSPPPAGNKAYALIDVGTIVVEPTGGESRLENYSFTVSK